MAALKSEAGPIGFGALPLSLKGRPSRSEAISLFHYILDSGIRFIDTADCYCMTSHEMHHNEKLIAEALQSYSGDRSRIIIATKGGIVRPGGQWVPAGSPKHIAQSIKKSIDALGGPLQLWQHHAPDPAYSIEQSLEPVAQAVHEGLIQRVGVSNYSVKQIEQAANIVELVSVQNQYNFWHRTPETDGVLQYCTDAKITFLPWSPLGGKSRVGDLSGVEALKTIAARHIVSVPQVILAWLRQRSPVILPIFGASTIAHAGDSHASIHLQLSSRDISEIDNAMPT